MSDSTSKDPGAGLHFDFKLFSDAIDALGKMVRGIIAIKDLPANERKRYLSSFDETFRIIGVALGAVDLRLGDLINKSNEGRKQDFINDLYRIGQIGEWLDTERGIRMSGNLRMVSREMNSIAGQWTGKRISKNWDELKSEIEKMLGNEHELAEFLSDRLYYLGNLAVSGKMTTSEYDYARDMVLQTRAHVRSEHKKMISAHMKLLEHI